MKKLFVLVVVSIVFSNYSFAQGKIKDKNFEVKTIYKQDPKNFCFYGTIWGGGGRINGNIRFLCGGNIAWLVGPSLGIGVSATSYKEYTWWNSGGLLIEPIVKPNYWVHVSFPTVLGFGYGAEKGQGESNSTEYFSNKNGFLYGETAVQLEFNPWKYMRLGIGFKIHGATGLNTYNDYKSMAKMKGYCLFMAIKFGKFH